MEEFKKRKSPRYKIVDYNSVGVYFITICTQNRECLLSQIVGTGVLDCPQPRLTAYGEVVDKYINQLSDFYDELSVESYVIMPNHIHLLLWIRKNLCSRSGGQSGTPVPTHIERSNSTCSRFVSTLKRFCNKEYGKSIWQPRFYDHIIRCQEDYDQHAKYIRENPINWYYDDLYVK